MNLSVEDIKKKYNLYALPIICLILLLLLIPKNVSFLSNMGMVSFAVYCYLSIVILAQGVMHLPGLFRDKISLNYFG